MEKEYKLLLYIGDVDSDPILWLAACEKIKFIQQVYIDQIESDVE